ncbi:MAG: MFS transporter [Chloroflexota bacterium]
MTATSEPYPSADEPDPPTTRPTIPPELAKQILISLIFPTMLMPLASATTRVALPIIRDDFMIGADVTAWVAAAFTLPFMVLMAVFGRLSDGLGKRRLLLAGVAIYSIGTVLTVAAPNLAWLIVGRAIQGIGGAGLTPLAMALIAAIYPSKERGSALGAWTTVGPATGFATPLIAGFLIDQWGWRMAFMPLLLFCLIALLAILYKVPPGLSNIVPGYARRFDWIGAGLLTISLSFLLFYLSSRPITGIEPLQDWRLLGVTLIAMAGFIMRENNHANPFIDLTLFSNPLFSRSAICASLRMFIQAGLSILLPLYLVDIYDLNAATLGGMLMITSGSMALVTRAIGKLADRVGSRLPALVGFGVQALVMLIYSQMPGTTPLWIHVIVLIVYGFGAGAVLVSLHRTAMVGLSEEQTGTAAGVYGTIRFAGAAVGTALAGVMLQSYLNQNLPELNAYQSVFFWYTIFPLIGASIVLGLSEPTSE